LKTNSIEIHEKLMETQDNVSFLSTQFDDVSKIRDDIRDLQSSRSNLITELSGITLELRQNNEIIRTNRENVELLQKELVSFDQNKEKSITELRVFVHEQLSHSNKAVEILRASQKKLKGKLIEILTNVTQLNDMKVTVKKLIEELENKMMEEISHTYEYDTSIQKHSNMINYLNEKVINLTTLLQNSTESREKVEESLSSSIQSTAQEYQEKLNALVKDFQLKLQQFTESNHHDKEIIADFMNEYKSFQNDFAKFKKGKRMRLL
jgi:chromosome segregation ATPase